MWPGSGRGWDLCLDQPWPWGPSPLLVPSGWGRALEIWPRYLEVTGRHDEEGANMAEGLILFVILARVFLWFPPPTLIDDTEWTLLEHRVCAVCFGRGQREAGLALRGLTCYPSKWEGQQSSLGPRKRLTWVTKLLARAARSRPNSSICGSTQTVVPNF